MAGNIIKSEKFFEDEQEKNSTISEFEDIEIEEIDLKELIDKKNENEKLYKNKIIEFSANEPSDDKKEKVPKKRGRKKKSEQLKEIEDFGASISFDVKEETEKIPKKRGRKKKEATEEKVTEKNEKKEVKKKKVPEAINLEAISEEQQEIINEEQINKEDVKENILEDIYSQEVKIQNNEYENEVEITLEKRKCRIETNGEEYNVYTNNSNSYLIVRQPKLRIQCNDAYISIKKYGEKYFVETNQNFSLNYIANNLEKINNAVTFMVENLYEMDIDAENLRIRIDEAKVAQSKLEDNNVLIISEEEGKVYLPYTKDEIIRKLENTKNTKVTEIIQDNYVIPIEKYKNSIKSRFREGYNLMYYREHKSKKSAIFLGLELMFEFNLHPSIITACKNLQELDIYLDCLEDNELEKFSCFKIIYKATPTVTKSKRNQRF